MGITNDAGERTQPTTKRGEARADFGLNANARATRRERYLKRDRAARMAEIMAEEDANAKERNDAPGR